MRWAKRARQGSREPTAAAGERAHASAPAGAAHVAHSAGAAPLPRSHLHGWKGTGCVRRAAAAGTRRLPLSWTGGNLRAGSRQGSNGGLCRASPADSMEGRFVRQRQVGIVPGLVSAEGGTDLLSRCSRCERDPPGDPGHPAPSAAPPARCPAAGQTAPRPSAAAAPAPRSPAEPAWVSRTPLCQLGTAPPPPPALLTPHSSAETGTPGCPVPAVPRGTLSLSWVRNVSSSTLLLSCSWLSVSRSCCSSARRAATSSPCRSAARLRLSLSCSRPAIRVLCSAPAWAGTKLRLGLCRGQTLRSGDLFVVQARATPATSAQSIAAHAGHSLASPTTPQHPCSSDSLACGRPRLPGEPFHFYQ